MHTYIYLIQRGSYFGCTLYKKRREARRLPPNLNRKTSASFRPRKTCSYELRAIKERAAQ